MLSNTFQVAILDDFLDAFARIPRAQQKKVTKFLRRFRDDPTSASINYESISDFVDPKMRSVRIDQAWRAIVVKPDQGNVYMLLWVDHHDKAYAWARNKRVEVHPDTGTLQILSTVRVEVPVAVEAGPALFEEVRDEHLRKLGVPQDRLEAVRAVSELADLGELQPVLPPEAFEALSYLADGEGLPEVLRAMEPAPETVDTQDFSAALRREETQRRFRVLDSDEELEAMLDAPLERWRVFLHPSQRRLVHKDWNGPVRVLGTAGTGKTVVAMHRAAHLARSPDQRLLFTTFTTNLAADIRANLLKLCPPDAMRRIRVTPIDAWVGELLKQAGYAYTIAYWRSETLEPLWNRALNEAPSGFDREFFRDEWDLVVQAHGCQTWEDYRSAPRSGRGIRLGRSQRKAVWPVFEAYRNLLDKAGLREPEDALRDAEAMVAQGKVQPRFTAIVVDEAQDMSTSAFKLLRAAVPEGQNDLFIVGDGHQRIYRRHVVLGRAGVEIRGRSKRLRVNYRTTEEIRVFAEALLQGVPVDDLDGSGDDPKGTRSLTRGQDPEVRRFDRFEDEVASIAAWVQEQPPERTCLMARTRKQRDRYRAALEAAGIATYCIERSKAEDPTQPGLRLATMHRVKGLEFDRVVLAGADAATTPLLSKVVAPEDTAQRSELWDMELSLLYVALTRARREVLITSVGEVSWALPRPEPVTGGPDLSLSKTCPRCGASGTIGELFGTRRMRSRSRAGAERVVVRAQSYCKECR